MEDGKLAPDNIPGQAPTNEQTFNSLAAGPPSPNRIAAESTFDSTIDGTLEGTLDSTPSYADAISSEAPEAVPIEHTPKKKSSYDRFHSPALEVVESSAASPYPTGSPHLSDRPWSPPLSQAETSYGIASPGLGVAMPLTGEEDGGKEVYNAPAPVDIRERTICGLRKFWFWALVLIIVVLIVAGLAVGLGVGLGTKDNKSSASEASPSPTYTPPPLSSCTSDYCVGGALDASYYSTTGAFNGSGIALASQSFGTDNHGTIVLYFQHHTGQIRWQQLANDGWQGGSLSEAVTADAKNGTPISAVAYSLNRSSTWHIFYIDKNNTVRQKTNSNTTNVWKDGPLSAMNLKAYDADTVGLQACWYGSFYGDADYEHSPLANGQANDTSSAKDVGMHLWFATDNMTFAQYGWRAGQDTWTQQQTWNSKNGHAGVGCYSWGGGSTTYVMFVNLENTVEVWWKDTNSTTKANSSHPINEWTNSSVAINNVHPSTSLGYTNFFYAQSAADDTIRGYNINFASENTTIVSEDSLIVGGSSGNIKGIPGTHFSVTAVPNNSGGNALMVFMQMDGDDVTMWQRDYIGGTWTSISLSIPDE